MSSLISFLPILFVPVLYALLVKLAAVLLRRTKLSWKHAFLFGLLALVVGAIGTFGNLALGHTLPALLVGIVGIAIQLSLGGWYFGPRAKNKEGEPIGFTRGMLLSLIALGIVFVVGVVSAIVVPALQHGTQA